MTNAANYERLAALIAAKKIVDNRIRYQGGKPERTESNKRLRSISHYLWSQAVSIHTYAD